MSTLNTIKEINAMIKKYMNNDFMRQLVFEIKNQMQDEDDVNFKKGLTLRNDVEKELLEQGFEKNKYTKYVYEKHLNNIIIILLIKSQDVFIFNDKKFTFEKIRGIWSLNVEFNCDKKNNEIFYVVK